MRIAFVYDLPYPWHKGGIEHILNIEAKELAKRHEVHFFTMKWPGMKKEFTEQNIRYHAFGSVTEETAYRHGRRSIREAAAFAAYSSAIFKYDFDLVISNIFPILHLPVIRTYCKLRKAKLILKVDEVWDKDYWVSYIGTVAGDLANAYANTVLKSDAYYVANSSVTARKLGEVGIEKSRIKVFAPILDGEINQVGNVKKRGKNIMFSGRFIKEKRIDKWLEIVKKVADKDSGVRGILVGDGIEKKKILDSIKTLKLGNKVTVKPFFKDKLDLYKEIASSRLLLHMSEREGLGIIALESLALGTPVVLPDYSPIPAEVKKMCVVEKEDKIVGKVLEMMRNHKSYIADTSNLKMFSASNVASFYENLYKSG